jgi:hypothetical protein
LFNFIFSFFFCFFFASHFNISRLSHSKSLCFYLPCGFV